MLSGFGLGAEASGFCHYPGKTTEVMVRSTTAVTRMLVIAWAMLTVAGRESSTAF